MSPGVPLPIPELILSLSFDQLKYTVFLFSDIS